MKLTTSFEKDLDRELAKRLRARQLPQPYRHALGARGVRAAARGLAAGAAGSAFGRRLRTIVRAHHRPSLLVQDDTFEPAVSDAWSGLLEQHRTTLAGVLPAVGRIELENHPQLSWVGTGFLVADNVLVTNRHVAHEFAERRGQGFAWRSFADGQADPGVNFLAEHERESARRPMIGILHVEDETGPDMAFFRVESAGAGRALELATGASTDDAVAVIGHPGRESGLAPEVERAMDRIFQDIFDVKRLAPGKVTAVHADHIEHDCSTLRGNSGSAVVDIETGQAVGLHYLGGFSANFAVRAATIDARLQDLS